MPTSLTLATLPDVSRIALGFECCLGQPFCNDLFRSVGFRVASIAYSIWQRPLQDRHSHHCNAPHCTAKVPEVGTYLNSDPLEARSLAA